MNINGIEVDNDKIIARERTLAAMSRDVVGFKVRFKDVDLRDGKFARVVRRVPVVKNVWRRWLRLNTTIYPYIYMSSIVDWHMFPEHAMRVLQHEWVHLKDAETLFGVSTRRLRRLNAAIFAALYFTPQLFATFALAAPIAYAFGAGPQAWWMLLFALFAAPIPSPFRMWIELRAYRRTRELTGIDPAKLAEHFVGMTYWYMWPFKSHVARLLQKPSPYHDVMDDALRD